MSSLENVVIETIKEYKLVESGDAIVLGVSGGPDSIAMLDIFLKLKELLNIKIYVAHINHGLRENAYLDEVYVKDFCNKNNIEVFIKHADIKSESQNNKIGIEEAGRKIRYDFLNEVMKNVNANKIAIAHNKNDNAETIIMNLLRGSGVNGLKGISEKNNQYIRPLIKASREEIENYCEEYNLNPRHDESNDENIYTRNKIRNLIIPYIKEEFNPNIIETLNRLSEITKEEIQYMQKQAIENFKKIQIKENEDDVCNDKKLSTIILDLKKFNELDIAIKRKVCLLAIEKCIGDNLGIEKIHIDDVIKLCGNNIGNKFLTPNKRIKVLVKNKKIYFFKV